MPKVKKTRNAFKKSFKTDILNKNQLNNYNLIDLDKYSNEYYFSNELNWSDFYNMQHKKMLHDMKYHVNLMKEKSKINDTDINTILENGNNNNITIEEIKTIKTYFINLENLAREKFFKD